MNAGTVFHYKRAEALMISKDFPAAEIELLDAFAFTEMWGSLSENRVRCLLYLYYCLFGQSKEDEARRYGVGALNEYDRLRHKDRLPVNLRTSLENLRTSLNNSQ